MCHDQKRRHFVMRHVWDACLDLKLHFAIIQVSYLLSFPKMTTRALIHTAESSDPSHYCQSYIPVQPRGWRMPNRPGGIKVFSSPFSSLHHPVMPNHKSKSGGQSQGSKQPTRGGASRSSNSQAGNKPRSGATAHRDYRQLFHYPVYANVSSLSSVQDNRKYRLEAVR